jgi:putative cell wall-binding protein
MNAPSVRLTILALALCTALAGCGKTFSQQALDRGAGSVAAIGAKGAGGLSTKNTTRLGGPNSAVDAAAVAVAVYPGFTNATRPKTVVLVDTDNWPAALAASVLAGSPLNAPILYSEGGTMPAASTVALNALKPTGAATLGGAQVLRIGEGGAPQGLTARAIDGNDAAAQAVAIERVSSALRPSAAHKVIVTAADGPRAMTMPAAGLAAQTGAAILYVERSSIPPITAKELERLGSSSIYVIGPSSVVSSSVAKRLESYGHVTRVAGSTPTENAIAVSRFTDGSFGWGVVEPGHGLVFANSSRPFDAPAAAPLSAIGDFSPLLLLESAQKLPPPLGSYLSDLQPGSPSSGAVHGVYNHGWVIGDESAIVATTQARLDSLLEISSRAQTEPAVGTPSGQPEESTRSTGP